MNKSTKNIILIIVMVVMLICSYFTVEKINNRSIPNMSESQKELFNRDSNKIEGEETQEKENSTTDSESSVDPKKKESAKRAMPNRPDDFKRDKNFNVSNIEKLPSNNNLIYIVLFGLESIVFGACGTYLVLLNTNKLKEKK